MDEFVDQEPDRDSSGVPPPGRAARILKLFYGPQGIRAGWSILIFLSILIAVILGSALLIARLYPDYSFSASAITPLNASLSEGAEFAMVLLATRIMSRIEHRSALSYGFSGGARKRRFAGGLACGLSAISVLVLVLDKLGDAAIRGPAIGGAKAWDYAAGWAIAMVCVALFEESLLRGYLQQTLARGIGFWWAAILLSLLFGLIHGSNPGESPVGLVGAAAIGLIFCLSVWYTRSLYWAVGFHAAWNWGETYLYGTPDSGVVVRGHLLSAVPVGNRLLSGGSTGPEGSILVLPLLAIVALFMFAWWGKRGRTA